MAPDTFVWADERVRVPSASDMNEEVLRAHIRLRHRAISYRPTRSAHEVSHLSAPPGLFDHYHREDGPEADNAQP